MKTRECDRNEHLYSWQIAEKLDENGTRTPVYAQSESCFRCGKLIPEANRQRIWTARMRFMLAHPERLDRVPPPPDYSTPAKISARAREAGTLGGVMPEENLYHKFRLAVERAGGVLEARVWPTAPNAQTPRQSWHLAAPKRRKAA